MEILKFTQFSRDTQCWRTWSRILCTTRTIWKFAMRWLTWEKIPSHIFFCTVLLKIHHKGQFKNHVDFFNVKSHRTSCHIQNFMKTRGKNFWAIRHSINTWFENNPFTKRTFRMQISFASFSRRFGSPETRVFILRVTIFQFNKVCSINTARINGRVRINIFFYIVCALCRLYILPCPHCWYRCLFMRSFSFHPICDSGLCQFAEVRNSNFLSRRVFLLGSYSIVMIIWYTIITRNILYY